MTTWNPAGERWAEEAIQQGDVSRENGWSFDAADSDGLLGDPPDWSAYGQFFLGYDPSVPSDTKEAWKYPMAKRVEGRILVFRSALEAIRHRSAQYEAKEIFQSAGRLLTALDRVQT